MADSDRDRERAKTGEAQAKGVTNFLGVPYGRMNERETATSAAAGWGAKVVGNEREGRAKGRAPPAEVGWTGEGGGVGGGTCGRGTSGSAADGPGPLVYDGVCVVVGCLGLIRSLGGRCETGEG
ncbi:hypothetical protein THAOC_23077, partial [Thalassiosira oceanica]